MNGNYVLITDSSTDLPLTFYAENSVELIPINFIIDGVEYPDDAGLSMGHKEFYAKIRSGATSSTSMINIAVYTQRFEEHLKAGRDILYLSISSGISGSFESASIAARELSERYPERKLLICDGLCASMGGALIMQKLVWLRDAGKTVEELRDWVEENKHHVIHLFTVDDLMHLRKGGRVSTTAAVVGSVLGVKPMLDVDPLGKLRACQKKRGRKGALEGLVEWMETFTDSRDLEIFTIAHGDCEEEADAVIEMVCKKFKVHHVIKNMVGPVIGSHTGPGVIAIFFMSERARV